MEPIPIPKKVTFFMSGYHPARFLDVVDEYFVCPICAWVVRGPISCARCEALYCKVCHDRLSSLREDICSRCKEPFEATCMRLYPRTVYSRYRLACSFQSYGCPFEATLREMPSHEESCDYSLVDCANPGCCNQFRIRDRQVPGKLVCSQRCADCLDFLQLFQSGVGTAQCLDFFVACVGKHKDKFRDQLRYQMKHKLGAACKDLEKIQKEVVDVTKKLSSIKAQSASEVYSSL